MNINMDEKEKIILDKIKKNIEENREFSFGIAKVEINNILKENLKSKEKDSNHEVKDNGEQFN